MTGLDRALNTLKEYNGKPLKIMEVCGTHTSAIVKNGIRDIISPYIRLVSGPGCPVCVTPGGYIDKLAEYAQMPENCVLSFGDMIKVTGSKLSLAGARAQGARVEMMLSPLDVCRLAENNPRTTYIIAAVGFETTAVTYTLLLDEILQRDIKNIKLLTSLKTMVPALDHICRNEQDIDAFICPGHVSIIIGSNAFAKLVSEYKKPFVITGFEGAHIIAALYRIISEIEWAKYEVSNLYKNAVAPQGNQKALAHLDKYFCPCDAMWRGIGSIPQSGLRLREEYSFLDGGSKHADIDTTAVLCRCSDVLLGRIMPNECGLYGNSCTPNSPAGPCMVSAEGACRISYKGAF